MARVAGRASSAPGVDVDIVVSGYRTLTLVHGGVRDRCADVA